jgi:two-component system chemotaxis sensor kinase CheA
VASGQIPVEQAPFELPASAPGNRLGNVLIAAGSVKPEAVERIVHAQEAAPPSKKIGELLVASGKISERALEGVLQIQRDYPDAGKTGEILIEIGVITEADCIEALEQQRGLKPKLGELLVESGEAAAKDVARALRSQRLQQQTAMQAREAVKVDADRLDQLIDTIGELVIAESMVFQSPELNAASRSGTLNRHLNQLDKITRELQEMGMSLRMVPIRSMFQKMARLVRDLAKKAGKQVEFVTVGEDTELDKSVVDKIGDPLVHMVRNAVDHGLESSTGERIRAGKSAVGRVELRAFHRGGSICIEIADDGRGLDRDAILAKAREKGLVREGETLSEREIWNLIFEPGFSTAKQITDVSGRGVGMDVVRKNIETLRGQVEIQSKAGAGTTFSIRLPLTLAIIDGMVVRAGLERYIVPILSIVMSVRPEARQISTVVGRGEMLSLQGGLLPLFRLARLFEIDGTLEDATQGIAVIVEDEGRNVALLVDEILGEQQIVIKSLGDALQGLPGVAGGAIMPDGTVGLILDVSGLVRVAGETPQWVLQRV